MTLPRLHRNHPMAIPRMNPTVPNSTAVSMIARRILRLLVDPLIICNTTRYRG
jgi:hypothetical protein